MPWQLIKQSRRGMKALYLANFVSKDGVGYHSVGQA